MRRTERIRRDEAGLVGKMLVVWLLLVALFGIAAVDTVSIAFTKLRTSDIASNAAADAANVWRDSKDKAKACEAAAASVAGEDPDAHIARAGCVINVQTGEATITVRKTASTMVADKVSFLQKFAKVESTESAGPTVL